MSQINSSVPQSSRHLDTITRVYKNAANNIIALHEIEVLSENLAHPRPGYAVHQEGLSRFLRRSIIKPQLMIFNRGSSEDRVIASTLQFGAYNSFLEDSGDVIRVIYTGNTEVNDLIIDLNLLPRIGDTL